MRIQLGSQHVQLDRRAPILAILLLLLATVGSLSTYYLFTRRPMTQLPVVQVVTRAVPPHFETAFYGVSAPSGIALSPDGQRIYVTETDGERQIRAFDRSGNQLAVFSPPDSKPGLRMPMYVATDKTGKVYVSDRLRAAIDVYDADGRYLYRFPKDGNTNLIQQPLGISIAADGSVYVTDAVQGQHRVLVFDASGRLKLSFGTEGSKLGQFSFPNDVLVANGRAYVSDSNNGRIAVFGLDGSPKEAVGLGTGQGTVGIPRGIAIDDNQRLYVVDAISHSVNVYDASSDNLKFLFNFGKEGLGQGDFSFPNGIAIDSTGKIFVTDRQNNRVHVWSYY